jgi:hypothetical protein
VFFQRKKEPWGGMHPFDGKQKPIIIVFVIASIFPIDLSQKF